MQKFHKAKKTLDYSGSLVYRRGVLNDWASGVLPAPKFSIASGLMKALQLSRAPLLYLSLLLLNVLLQDACKEVTC